MALLPVDDALDAILAACESNKTALVDLSDASGRILANDVKASFDQPPFDGSAMDGYALNAKSGTAGKKLELVGVSAAGMAFDAQLKDGQCARIYTGAPMPAGADCVIMQEKVTVRDGVVELNHDVVAGQNVRDRGNDFKDGQTLVVAGTRLSPFHLSLCAAANLAQVAVFTPPTVFLLGTGDELVPPGTELNKDQIIASNNAGLKPLFEQFGAVTHDQGIVEDDKETLKQRLKDLLDEKPDILMTTGGASVGDKDYVKEVLEELGVELDFWRIAVRPGKPLMFGKIGNTLVFGLPGNPVSALITGTVFVTPAIRALQGDQHRPELLLLPLTAPLSENGARQHYRRAKLRRTAQSGLAVDPNIEMDSAHLTSLAKSDCFVVQKPNCGGKDAGDLVHVLTLPWAAI